MEQNNRLVSRLGSIVIVGSMGIALAASGDMLVSTGNVVTSNYGECMQTSNWNQELSTPKCDAALAARLESEKLAAGEARIAAKLGKLESPAAAVQSALVRLSDTRNVMFEFNSGVLTPVAVQEMGMVLGIIRELDQVDRIEIIGHTDSSGSERYNQKLSERRSASVKQFLEARGVARSVIAVRGAGESSPIADNGTLDGRAKNRRVDILISGDAIK